MPRPNRGYQLAFYKPRGYKDRQWVIFWYEHGTRRERASGFKDSRAIKAAEAYRTEWVAVRERPRGPSTPDGMTVAQALEIYGREHGPSTADPSRIGYAIEALLPYWGELSVAAVRGE